MRELKEKIALCFQFLLVGVVQNLNIFPTSRTDEIITKTTKYRTDCQISFDSRLEITLSLSKSEPQTYRVSQGIAWRYPLGMGSVVLLLRRFHQMEQGARLLLVLIYLVMLC